MIYFVHIYFTHTHTYSIHVSDHFYLSIYIYIPFIHMIFSRIYSHSIYVHPPLKKTVWALCFQVIIRWQRTHDRWDGVLSSAHCGWYSYYWRSVGHLCLHTYVEILLDVSILFYLFHYMYIYIYMYIHICTYICIYVDILFYTHIITSMITYICV